MKVAVVGIRGMGRSHLQAARRCNVVTDVAGCDIDPEMRRQVEEKLNIRTWPDVDSLLSDFRPDAVVVATGPNRHAEVIRACLERNVAVLTEKPICSTLDDSRAMVDLAERRRVPFQVGFEVRYSGFMRAVQDVLAQGLLGRLNHIWLIQLSGPHQGNAMDRQRTGGVFYEKLCHQVDTFRYLLGEPRRVSAIAAPNSLRHYGVEDNVSAVFEFPDAALGTITFNTRRAAQVNGLADGKPQFEGWEAGHFYEFGFTGDKGTAVFDAWTSTVEVTRFNHRDDDLNELVKRIDVRTEYGEPVYAIDEQDGDFFQRVAAHQPPRFPAADALKTMEWVELAEQSLRQRGAWLPDPAMSARVR